MIPDRYKSMGFTRVGQEKKSTRDGKKWMVLAKKGDQYKVVHGGDSSMKDFSQHKDKERQKNFWNRMGATNDKFSPRYWHKRLGTWETGGDTPCTDAQGNVIPCPQEPYTTMERFNRKGELPSYLQNKQLYKYMNTPVNNSKYKYNGIVDPNDKPINNPTPFQSIFTMGNYLKNNKSEYEVHPSSLRNGQTFPQSITYNRENPLQEAKKGGYINNNGRYVHKDGKTTSRPGLWSNVYMKKNKKELGGDSLCYDNVGNVIPCDEQMSNEMMSRVFNPQITTLPFTSVQNQLPKFNANRAKNINRGQYVQPNYVAPFAFNSLVSSTLNNYNNNINSNNILSTAEYNNPYDNKFTQYNKCGGKVYKKMMKSGGFVKYEDGGETRSEIQEERQEEIGLRQMQLDVFFNNKEVDNSQQYEQEQATMLENPYIANTAPVATNTPASFYKPTEIETFENKEFNINKIAEAIGQYESGNRYNIKGNTVTSGTYKGEKALGKYQIMPGNLPQWSKEALGRVVSQEEFLSSPEIQDAVAKYQMQKIAKKHNNPVDVASIWLSGKPFGKSKAKDVNGTNQTTYVKNVMKFYK